MRFNTRRLHFLILAVLGLLLTKTEKFVVKSYSHTLAYVPSFPCLFTLTGSDILIEFHPPVPNMTSRKHFQQSLDHLSVIVVQHTPPIVSPLLFSADPLGRLMRDELMRIFPNS